MSPQRMVGFLGWLLSLSLCGASCNGAMFGEAAPSSELPDAGAPTAGMTCTTLLIDQVVGPTGEVLRAPSSSPLAGAKLEIPAAALDANTRVRLSIGTDLHADGTPNSSAICVDTEGKSFKVPATLVMPYSVEKLAGRSVEYLAMAKASGPDVVGRSLYDAEIMSGILLQDDANKLAAVQIQDPTLYQLINIGTARPAATTDLSLLLVVDNSGSMTPKQQVLADRFPDFFRKVTRYQDADARFAKCIQYNIGIITTDMGSDGASSGDNGRLQNTFCNQRTGLSVEAQTACASLNCGAVTPISQRFIKRSDVPLGMESLQEGQFKCMALVGDNGSGVEQPLESMRQAIKSDPDVSAMPGFFRKKGINALMFITDEGDVSMDSAGAGRTEFWNPTIPCDAMNPIQPSCYLDPNDRSLGVALKCTPTLNTPVDAMETCTDLGTASPVLKTATAYAANLKDFIVALNDGNSDELDRLLVRGLWPIQQGHTTRMTLDDTITWQLRVANWPPSQTLRKDAFCYDDASLMTNEPILGHPQLRLNNFAKQIANAGGGTGVPQVSVGSICVQDDREHVLDDLADTILNSYRVLCPMPLI